MTLEVGQNAENKCTTMSETMLEVAEFASHSLFGDKCVCDERYSEWVIMGCSGDFTLFIFENQGS